MRTLACRSGSLGLALAAGVAAVIIVTATPASAQSMDDVEARLLELLNAERRVAGIDELEPASDRANILDPAFDQVGIGAVVADGILWVTQDFRRHAQAEERAAVPVAASPGPEAASHEEPSDRLSPASSEDSIGAPSPIPSTTPGPAPTPPPPDDNSLRSVVRVASTGAYGTVRLSELDALLPTAVPKHDVTIGLVLFLGLAARRWRRAGV